jgi:outer membrane protein OmpA-like peptidoglycan-associated protein
VKRIYEYLANGEWLVASGKILFILLIGGIGVQTNALPVGDPRTPDSEALSRIETPVEQGVHELAVHAFMGASRISYPDVGGTLFSPGFGAAFTYSLFFTPNWSFLVGGGIQLFNNRGSEVDPDFSSDENEPVSGPDINDLADGGGDRIYLYYDFKDYSEKQWSLMFMVPIMLQYQSNEYRNKAFYYALGVKLGFPFAGAYEGKTSRGRVCGYYPDIFPDYEPNNFDECYSGGLAGMGEGFENEGFGDFGAASSRSKMKLGSAFFAAAEAGIKWRLYNKFALYTGFWLDWGINDVAINAVSRHPFSWTPSEGSSKDGYTPNADIEFKSRTRGRAFPMALGFTVRFALGGGSHHLFVDTLKWMRQIDELDSLLTLCRARNARLEADSAQAANTIAYLNEKADAFLDSLLECRVNCMEDADREALKRQIDSLAREAEAKRLADLERARLAALERARLDSIENAILLESQRAARLADFRSKLNSIMNGLDDYRITQTVPSESARKKLDIASDLMRDYPDLRIQIVGHTCDRGTHEANVRFGQQRAISAKNYLIAKGINAARLETSSKAELEPLFPNVSEDNRRKNRRVQIIILEGAQLEKEAK